jgi:hypothetical protein
VTRRREAEGRRARDVMGEAGSVARWDRASIEEAE